MYSLLRDVGNYVKLKKCVIDNFTFRLHYRFTFGLLFAGSLLSTANMLIGDKIDCYVERVDKSVMNSFCWIQGTFTIPSQITESNAIHPGVGSPTAGEGDDNIYEDPTIGDPEDVRHHAWYQWVAFVLFIQAVMCYTPHHLWKAMEGGKLNAIVNNFERYIISGKKEENRNDEDNGNGKQRKNIVEYLERSRGSHNWYAYQFLICEFLNLFNIVLQAYWIDWFLGYEFTTYGTDVIAIAQQAIEKRVDPMVKIFPRLTKCTFNSVGTSGTKENWDGLCVLPINIINEKIYIAIWFWFLFLIIWTTVHLMIEMLVLSSTNFRTMSIKYECNSIAKKDIALVMKGCKENYGDFFLLKQMAAHIDPMEFQKIVEELKMKYSKSSKSVKVSSYEAVV